MKKYHLLLILCFISAKYALSAYKANLITDNEVITEILESEVKRKEGEAYWSKYIINRRMDELQKEEIHEIHLVYEGIKEVEKDTLKYQNLLLYTKENRDGHRLLEGFEVVEAKYIELPEVLKYHFLKADVFRYLKSKIPDRKRLAEKDMKIVISRIIEIGTDSVRLGMSPARCLPITNKKDFLYKDEKIEVNTNPFYFKGDIKNLKMD